VLIIIITIITTFLHQRIATAIQPGNADAALGTKRHASTKTGLVKL